MEERIKRYFWKGSEYDEIILLLETVTMCKSVSDHLRDI